VATASGSADKSPRGAVGRRSKPPRTQAERAHQTRSRILAATLNCLKTRGYAGTTLSRVQKGARVSRGALLHHFRTKHELVASAMATFYEGRLERHQRHLAALPPGASLRDRLSVMQAEAEQFFPVTIEFNLAMSTDPRLYTAFDKAIEPRLGDMKADYSKLLPEFADNAEGLWILYLIGCFHRGLCLEARVSDPKTVEKTVEQFAQILETYIAQRGEKKPPGVSAK
jgi:AcrR family transcriptional regulator